MKHDLRRKRESVSWTRSQFRYPLQGGCGLQTKAALLNRPGGTAEFDIRDFTNKFILEEGSSKKKAEASFNDRQKRQNAWGKY